MSSTTTLVNTLTTNGDRLSATLHESCQWGATDDGGMNRLALNDDDKKVRDWIIAEAKKLKCKIIIDSVGNIFMVREGLNNDIPPIGIGSHLDTQPTGGRYDGILGVQAGLEVMRTLHDNNYTTYAPVATIVWTNEEGARFPTAMLASGVWSGAISEDDCYKLEDVNAPGVTFLHELERIGYRGEVRSSYEDIPLSAHFELHIEQGPILEEDGIRVGIVEGVQGMRWFEAEVIGREQHTGTTPMDRRKDTLVCAAMMIQCIEETANEHKGLGSVGIINSMPQSMNTIPGKVGFSIDIRHGKEDLLAKYEADLFKKLQAIADSRKCTFTYKELWGCPVVDFDKTCVSYLRESAEQQKLSHIGMQSGAGHDSCHTQERCPTAMLFIPCKGGISHNPAEFSTAEQMADGVQVLIGGILRYDNYLREQNEK